LHHRVQYGLALRPTHILLSGQGLNYMTHKSALLG